MPWTVQQLRSYRQYPQEDTVIQRALDLAEADVDRINSKLVTSDPERRDRAVEQLVQIDLEPPNYSGNEDGGIVVNSRNDARNRILSQLVGAGVTISDGRVTQIMPPYYRW